MLGLDEISESQDKLQHNLKDPNLNHLQSFIQSSNLLHDPKTIDSKYYYKILKNFI
jgi:hypothetical protein